MNLRIGSHGFHLSLTVLGIAAGALVGLAWAGNRGNPAYERWLANVEQELRPNRARQAHDRAQTATAERLRRAGAAQGDSTAAWRTRYSLLVEGLRVVLAGRGDTASVNALAAGRLACFAAITACTARGDSLAAADSVDKQRAETNAQGWAHADDLLAAGVKVQECRVRLVLFSLGCPSRTETFFTGAGLVELLHLIFHK